MKPVSSQPPLPMTPNQNDVTSISSWTGDITRQLYTYLREIVYRLNKAVTHDVLASVDKDEGASLVGVEDAAGNFTGTNVEEVLAEIGNGGGYVKGPTSSIADRLASFDGTSGKLIKDSGYTAASFLGATAQAVDSAKLGGQLPAYYLDAGNLGGTLADARLSSNVPLENTNNNFTGTNGFYGALGVGRAPSAIGGMYFNRNPDNPFVLFSYGDPAVATTDIGQLRASGAGKTISVTDATGGYGILVVHTDTKLAEVALDPVSARGIASKGYVDTAIAATVSAWVTFAGSTGAIRDGYNVSSVTRNAAGDYTVHFATAMANANYGFSINAQRAVGAGSISAMTSVSNAAGAIGTTALRVITGDTSGNPVDCAVASVVVFGGK